jgi:hypothetical protein
MAYREHGGPIVLSDGYARLLNACITEDVVTMCMQNGIVHRNHFGGRPGRSTTDAIHYLGKIVKDAWRKGKVVSLLSLDVKGAFPSTAIDRLLHNMRMRGIPGEIVEWMERRLEHRKTRLTFDDFESELFPIDNGLDQGDPFSQICYILYNAGQLEIVNPRDGEDGILYINDSNILALGDDFTETHNKIRAIMEREGGVFDWAREHNCEFGVDKFQLLDLSRKRKIDPANPRKRIPIERHPIKIGTQVIPSKTSIKFLGMQIDRELYWREQGAVALKRGQDWILQFGRLSRTTGGVAGRYVRQLYNAIAVPRMLYAADVFLVPQRTTKDGRGGRMKLRGGAIMNQLAAVQQRAAIMITGTMSTTATDVLDIHANLLPFHLLHQQKVGQPHCAM